MQRPQRVRDGFSGAVVGVVLAVLAVVTLPVWGLGLLYTPLGFFGGRMVVVTAVTISGFIALLGLAFSVDALLDVRRPAGSDSYRRASIVRTGGWGVFLSVSAMILMVFLALWFPVYGRA